MSRIGYTLTGIERQLLNSLSNANAQIAMSAYRMATGHKINQAGDNPDGFFQLSGLQSEYNGVASALTNISSASTMIAETQSTLSATQTQLNLIRDTLETDVAHALTPDQRAAAQKKIDEAVQQINILAGTQILTKEPLSGQGDYSYANRDVNQVADIQVSQLGWQGQQIYGSVTSAATQAQLTYTGTVANQVVATATFTLTGTSGDQTITATAGDTLQSVADKVNDNSYITGVTARVDTTSHELTFTSVDYGSRAKTEIAVTSGTFTTTGDTSGTNASAIINGQTISSDSPLVDGNRFSLGDAGGMTFSIEFKAGYSGAFNSMSVTGDALTFALTPEMARKSSLAIPAVFAANLGGMSGTLDQLVTGGSLSGLNTNTAQAIRVVDEALGKLTRVSGNVNGFKTSAIDSSSAQMTAMKTDLQESIDTLDKTDDAEEVTIQAYYQGLAANSLSGLAILDQQRQQVVNLLQQIAGLSPTNW
jgi:flagellin-like hook-associated protein FlgL